MSGTSVGPGGDRRTVTVTFGYGEHLRSIVAPNLRDALEGAERRWGKWATIESISTPDTIYADVTGLTKARVVPGVNRGGARIGTASKLRAIGYEWRPGEIGSVRRGRDELPRTFHDPSAPTGEPNWTPSQKPKRWRLNWW